MSNTKKAQLRYGSSINPNQASVVTSKIGALKQAILKTAPQKAGPAHQLVHLEVPVNVVAYRDKIENPDDIMLGDELGYVDYAHETDKEPVRYHLVKLNPNATKPFDLESLLLQDLIMESRNLEGEDYAFFTNVKPI